MLTAKEKKRLCAIAHMQKARAHIGYYGVTRDVLMRIKTAYDGTCVYHTRVDVLRVKVQKSFTGDLLEAIKEIEEFCGVECIKAQLPFLTFYKIPIDEK